MSAPNSDSENSCASDSSDYNFIPCYEIEVEPEITNKEQQSPSLEEDAKEAVTEPYADEPIASNEWIKEYEREREEEAFWRELQNRLDWVNPVSTW